ncbi:MAG: hypothetical protein M1812_006938 [Candelaria pacifica]|nr:MAG: hypothetical protein M1812_006938 [Candelaria pacifica]
MSSTPNKDTGIQDTAIRRNTDHQINAPISTPSRNPPVAADGPLKEHAAQPSNPLSSVDKVPERLNTVSLETPLRSYSQWKPDTYAPSFVPQQLRSVNFSPATTLWSEPMPTMDYAQFILSFAGTDYLVALEPLTPVTPSLQEQHAQMQVTPHLDPANYRQSFHSMLSYEYEAQLEEHTKYNMYKTEVKYEPADNTFSMRVPGLRENTPRVDLGDYISLRQLRLDPTTSLPYMMPPWYTSGQERGMGFVSPGFTGLQHMACVVGLVRATEIIYFRMDSSFVAESMIFNACFSVPSNRFQPLERAVLDVYTQLQSAMQTFGDRRSAGRNQWIMHTLYPEEINGEYQVGLPQGVFHRVWVDTTLNFEQRRAVDGIMRQNYGKIPFLVSGPPGTGKTKTLIETTLQWLSRSPPTRHMLVCAPSDQAADVLANRLRVFLSPKDLFRLNAFSRSFAEVLDELLPYCYIKEASFSLPSFSKLMSYKVVVTTCRDADILVQARVTNRDLLTLEHRLLKHINPGRAIPHEIHNLLHWTALLVDEAAQAPEPEVDIALTVVAPPLDSLKKRPLVVMAGDQQQLGPRTTSKQLALETSLFERLFDRPIYRDHSESRRAQRVQSSAITSNSTPMLVPPFANLVRNYRSHPAILSIPSALFYHDSLIPEATNSDRLKDWTGWKGRRWPVLFASSGGGDCLEREGGGWYNIREAYKACDYALSLVNSGLVQQNEICIMSPFPAQVQMLRRTIRRPPYSLYAVNIGPTEAFQGLESPVVILCTTRARSRFLKDDNARGLGVINEAKRFNVALTRAKQGLIVLGNPWILATDSNWRAFLGFCRRHGLWEDEVVTEGPAHPYLGKLHVDSEGRDVNSWNVEDDVTPAFISRLETGLIYKERDQGTYSEASMGGSHEDAMWVSGLAAEEALREG